MKKEPTPRVFREVTQAFKAAVATTKGEGGAQCRYKVADSSGRIPHSCPRTDVFIQAVAPQWGKFTLFIYRNDGTEVY